LANDSRSVYAKSAGTYCFVDEILTELGLYIVKLPSGIRKVINEDSVVRVGRNSNISQKFSIIGKAGSNIKRGAKQIVRGVAMNPVDHPNGGRTKTNKPEKSL
jgi:large subunit ribosomal protein L2